MVAKASGVDRIRNERMAEGVHLHERGHARGVAEVIAVLALGQARAGGWFDATDGRVHVAGHLLSKEREGEAAEVRSATGATNKNVGGLADLGELQECFLADDRLMHQHVVEHAAERVAGVRIGDGHGDRLGDRDAEAAGVVRVLSEDRAAVLGDF